MMTRPKNPLFGIGWMLLYCVLATVTAGMVRYFTMQGLSSHEILFVRCLVGALILLPFVVRRHSLMVPRATFWLFMWRGLFAFLGVAIWFYILQYAPFTSLMAVGFTAPLFTALLAMLFLGEARSPLKIIALLLGFCGTLVVTKPFGTDFNVYLLIAVGSAFLWSISLLYAKQLSDDQPPILVSFYFSAVVAVPAFFVALPVWEWPTMVEWVYLLSFAAVASFGQMVLVWAFYHADLTTLMPLEYSNLLFGAVFSYFVFGEWITFDTLLGGAIILGSGYMIVRYEKRRRHVQDELDIIP